MSDFEKLINASDLIEWIIETDPDWCVGSVRCIIDHIDKMPSAQPEKRTDKCTETHSCDCISRQATMDEMSKQQTYKMFEGEDTVYLDANDVGSVLASMPSAQPDSKETSPTHKALDTISRQAAIDAHYEYCNKHPDASFPVWSLKILEDLPSAQPDMSEYSDKLWKKAYERGKAEAQQKWIPCSERLPEERQEILATTTDNAWGDVVIIRTYYKEMHKSVIAWMPLPEPYAERRTDEAR